MKEEEVGKVELKGERGEEAWNVEGERVRREEGEKIRDRG